MKLAHKIWLGFGLLIVVPVAIGAAAYLGIRTIEKDLRQLAGVERPTSEAVEQMEHSVAGTESGVLAYVETGDAQYREQAEHHARLFEDARDQYAGMVETGERKELAARIGSLYGEYKAVGDDLMNRRDSQDSKLSRVDENLQRAGHIAEDIQANLDQGEGQKGSGGSEKAEAAAKMEAGIAELRTWLGAYLIRPEGDYKERASDAAEDFTTALKQFKELELTEQEKDGADELEELVDETVPLAEKVISANAATREDLSKLFGLRADMGEILSEAQLSTRQELSAATEAANQATQRVAKSILILLAIGLGIGGVTAVFVGGRIIRSVRRLAEGATKLADGTLERHIDVATRDEMGLLATSLNRMAEERKHNEEELEHLGKLVGNRVERVTELEKAIVDLRNEERVLGEGKERGDLNVDASSYGIFDWDLCQNSVYWDDRILEILGLSREEIAPTYEAFLGLIHPNDQQRVKDAITAHLDGHAGHNVEYRVRHSDGGYRNCVSYARTQRDSEGVPLRMVGVINDVTEHRALGEQLVHLAPHETEHAEKPRHARPEAGRKARASECPGLENDLRLAIERGEFVVHYQPIVSLEALKVSAFEALFRWNHPERGLLTPMGFLPLAEETGLIVPIGQWVLKEACRQARVWHQRYPRESSLTVSVNLSPRQLNHPDLVESIARALMDAQLDPRGLVLEVTENVLMEDPHTAGATLQQLKELHVGIAIDDFGAARSPASRLEHLPIDILKVDRSLVARLGEENGDGVTVSEVIGLASELGLDVIAKGVETYRQLAHLQALGCARAQGYYFSRPVPAQVTTPILQSNWRG